MILSKRGNNGMIISLTGFNGERTEPIGGHTHLGNGYRAYSPVLSRFTIPDSWSPFGKGGLNAYAYCSCDPVNLADPSGHFSTGQALGMALGFAAGLALGILTDGAALPLVLSLFAAMAGEAVIGASAEIVTQAIDGHKINWDQVGIAMGVSAVAPLGGMALGRMQKMVWNRASLLFAGSRAEGTEAGIELTSFIRQRTLLGISGTRPGYAYYENLGGVNVTSLYGHGTAESLSSETGYLLNNSLLKAPAIKPLLESVPYYNQSESIRLDFCYSAQVAQELSRLMPDKYIGGITSEVYGHTLKSSSRDVSIRTVEIYEGTAGTASEKFARARDYFMTAVSPGADFSKSFSRKRGVYYHWYKNGELWGAPQPVSPRQGKPPMAPE